MAAPQGAALAAAGGGGGGGGAAAPFAGPAADLRLGELLLDVLPIAAAVGFAADVSQCVQLCGVTYGRRARRSRRSCSRGGPCFSMLLLVHPRLGWR